MVRQIERRIEQGLSLPRSLVEEWMTTDDLESMGAVMSLLYGHHGLIDDMPTMDAIIDLSLRYYDRCLRENPDGEYAPSRYIAGYEFVRWYRMMRRDEAVPETVLMKGRQMLRRVYEEGDEETRKAVIQGALEHLLESPDIRADFDDWRREPGLRAAYREALEWSEGMQSPGSGSG